MCVQARTHASSCMVHTCTSSEEDKVVWWAGNGASHSSFRLSAGWSWNNFAELVVHRPLQLNSGRSKRSQAVSSWRTNS